MVARGVVAGLAGDAGLAAAVGAGEGGGRELAAEVAINAAGVDEEVAGGVLGQAVGEARHGERVWRRPLRGARGERGTGVGGARWSVG